MKKIITLCLLLLVVVATGCLNYKAYDLEEQTPAATTQLEEAKENATPKIVEEDVVLPKLGNNATTNKGPMRELRVKENQNLKLNVKVYDPDDDEVTYTFSKPFSPAGLWKANYGDAGEYIITIKATDDIHTTEEKVRLIVERVNVPPQIEAVQDITVTEGKTVSFTPKVTDPNKDKVTITVSKPLENGKFVTDHTSAGVYDIKVVATDGELKTEKTFKLTVEDVNVKPKLENVPSELSVKEGEKVTIKPKITDLDNDKVTLTIGEPVGNDGEWTPSFTDHGEYSIAVVADDGKDKVTKTVKLVVGDINMPPEIIDVKVETR